MFGYSGDALMESANGIMKNIYSGHAAIYIGEEDGEDYIVEAMADGIVKTPAKYFVNLAEGENFLGARIPDGLDAWRQAKVVIMARNLAESQLAYDFDFHRQKGPGSGEWTCVGLTEKLYESADIVNPYDLSALEYNPEKYAINITPDGFDDYSQADAAGDRFSKSKEFSQVARRRNIVVPAPEIIGYDLGLIEGGKRFIFFPYTQFIQDVLRPVASDVEIASRFDGSKIRASFDSRKLVISWSLINNPLSSLKVIGSQVGDAGKTVAVAVKNAWQDLSGFFFADDYQDIESVLAASGDEKENASDLGQSVSYQPVAVNKATNNTSLKADEEKEEVTKNKDDDDPETKISLSVGKESLDEIGSSGRGFQLGQLASLEISHSSSTLLAGRVSETQKTAISLGPKDNQLTAYYDKTVTHKAGININKTASSSITENIISDNSSRQESNKTAPATSTATASLGPIYISRIYASGSNDSIELLNGGNQELDLGASGFRLEKTRTADDPSILLRFGDEDDAKYPGGLKIAPGARYLITSRAASAYWQNRADAIVSREGFSWSGNAYTIYLGKGPISSSLDDDIIDAVGFGQATYFRGSAPAPEIKDGYLIDRYQDQKDNHLDYRLLFAADPDYPQTAASENNDQSASNNNQDNSSEQENNNEAENSSSPLALISGVYASGDNDWIELYNPGEKAFDLAAASFRLEKSKTAEDPSLIIRIGNEADGDYPGGTVIPAGGRYLIVRDDASSYFKDQADAIAKREEFSWSGKDYSFFLAHGAVSSGNDQDIVDLLGIGAGASRYQGLAPAPELIEGYYLKRVSNSHENSSDFILSSANDPDYQESGGDSEEPEETSSGFTSPALSDLWHFDECYDAEKVFILGRWDCGQDLYPDGGNASGQFSKSLPAASFSFSFWYFKYDPSAAAAFEISRDDEGEPIKLTVRADQLLIENLPASHGYYNLPQLLDSGVWHQVVLVVDQAMDNWSVYLDGVSVVSESFIARLDWQQSGWRASNYSAHTSIDEIAAWPRPLSSEEVATIYASNQVFAPFTPLAAVPLELKHFWTFSEDVGTSSADVVGGLSLPVAADSWTGRKHDDYAIKVHYGQDFSVDMNEVLPSSFSSSFWWRNESYPDIGRLKISLFDDSPEEGKIFSATLDYDQQPYIFNGVSGFLGRQSNSIIPNDSAWHHFAFVYDVNSFSLKTFVDGVKIKEMQFVRIKDGRKIGRLSLSSDSSAAAIDDLSLWSGALSPDNIKDIYTNNK